MSVLKTLIQNHSESLPSMESAIIEQKLTALAVDLDAHTKALNAAVSGSVSFESSTVLDLLCYYTEAAEGQTLVQRIWEGIKKIFGKIKEFVVRLLSIRKRYLANNELKIEKLKKYAQAIPTDRKPSGKIRPATTLLPRDPGKAISAIQAFRTQGEQVMGYRNKSLDMLQNIDVKQLTVKHVEELTGSLYGQGSHVEFGRRTALFTQSHEAIDYRVSGLPHEQNLAEVPAASVVTMNSLIVQYEKLLAEDGKFLTEIEKSQVDADHFLKKLDNLKSDNSFTRTAMGSDDAQATARHTWSEAARMMRLVGSVNQLTHTHVWSSLMDDIETILRASLGVYKFKEGEVKDEDRTDKKKDGDHEYR